MTDSTNFREIARTWFTFLGDHDEVRIVGPYCVVIKNGAAVGHVRIWTQIEQDRRADFLYQPEWG